ncbi:multidrug transporter [Oribacterium sp. C9]|uniref:efflux RND transporter permease subunit n=1 Tax=Oribacterium sp. C9 TaxID=1943579 RepID=UPI0009CA4D49|nr:MMPL family transporter [Oribacterium sp. C9]OON86442.1 multidrug transporter [Oribacterium sp. C9]
MSFFNKKKKAVASKAEEALKAIKIAKRGNVADFIVDHNIGIRNIIIMLVVVFAICYPFVSVNYDLTKYLPNDVDSKIAINKMREVFGYPGTGRLMLKDVSLYEAKQYKNQIEKIDGVDQVVWCDTTTQIYGSSEFIDYDKIDDYYDDGYAVMDITFVEGDTSKRTHRAISDIDKLIEGRGSLVGMSPTNKFIEENVKKEMAQIMVIVVILIFFILLFTTTSWFEPILFLTVIGCAIVINKGSNIFLGEISYITNNISDILQLATSMDYSVFLLHAYERQREAGLNKEEALKVGLMGTITTILASSLTTFFGFIVLVFMRFSIGWDMGIVMSKGIICSLFMVIFLMPSLLLSWSDKIDQMRHKPFLPSFHGLSVVVNKISPVLLIVSLVIAGPIYIAQGMNDFKYGPDATGAGPGTSMYENSAEIDEKFGRSNLLVAIFPDNDRIKEKELCDELKDLQYVKKVMGMESYLPEGMPENFLPGSVTELFHKDGYARLLIYIKTKPESTTAFRYSQEVSDIINRYYPGEAYITGNTPTTMDMEEVLIPDYNLVNALAMLSIFIVVAISFKSVVMPIVAMVPIMMAIYVNMSLPYLSGSEIIFIAYAVVSCIQLGSTIDYAISSTESYLQSRGRESDKRIAARMMTELSFPSILTSGIILIVCGYAISIKSSIPAIGQVGHLVGRGAIFSVIFVTCLMPTLLKIADRLITGTFLSRHERRKKMLRQFKQYLHDKRAMRNAEKNKYREVEDISEEMMRQNRQKNNDFMEEE